MKIIALTGGIATGKSFVSRCFKELGAEVLDLDVVAREVVEPETPCLLRLIDFFGKDYLTNEGALDRAKLGDLIFNDKNAKDNLDQIIGPFISARADEYLKEYEAQGTHVLIFDAPLLIEKGQQDRFRPLVLTACPESLQVSRLMKRNNLTEEAAWARIHAQLPTNEKAKYADHILDTSLDKEATRQKVFSLFTSLIQKEIHHDSEDKVFLST